MAPSIMRIRPMAASCVKTPKATPRPHAISAMPSKTVPSAQADALAACLRIFDVGPAAADKNDGDHQAKQQQSEIGEAGKLGKHADSADIKTTPIRLKVIVSNPRVASGFNHEGYEGTRRKSSRIPPSVDRVLRGS